MDIDMNIKKYKKSSNKSNWGWAGALNGLIIRIYGCLHSKLARVFYSELSPRHGEGQLLETWRSPCIYYI